MVVLNRSTGWQCGAVLSAVLVFGCGTDASEPAYLQVSQGEFKGCALTGERELVCWDHLEEDIRPLEEYLTDETRPLADGKIVADISVGGSGACALFDDGAVLCWSLSWPPVAARMPDPGEGTRFVKISNSDWGLCAIASDGELYCDVDYRGGTQPLGEGPFVDLSVGADGVCGVRQDGTLGCEDVFRRPGDYETPLGEFQAVSRGWGYMCALGKDQTLTCWGEGTGAPEPSDRFVDVSVDTDGFAACGVKTSGRIACWGGSANNGRIRSSPAPGERFSSVSVGKRRTCGITRSGDLSCWLTYEESR